MQNPILENLLTLSHELGREERGLAILGEGNTSALLGDKTFLIKASGSSVANLKPEDAVECRFSALLPLLDNESLTGAEVGDALIAARVDLKAKKPSAEVIAHAWLLTQPGVKFVARAHATAVSQILCSPRAGDFSRRRMFPTEVFCCGPASVLVPYAPPGLKLARAIRAGTEAFLQQWQKPPQVILIQNQGIITLGPTWQSVLAAMLMAEKAARIFLGATALGGPVFLSPEEVAAL